jgi:hypothetical protein
MLGGWTRRCASQPGGWTMIKVMAGGAAFFAAALLASAASADVYAEDLGKCMVKATSDADNITVIQWIYDAISLNPAIKSGGGISAAQKVADDKGMAALFDRLLFKDCRAESILAIKNEGAQGFYTSFELLGKTAMVKLTSDPKVSAGIGDFGKYIDKAEMRATFKEAGAESQLGPNN